MKWVFFIIIIVCLCDIEEKLKKLLQENNKQDNKNQSNVLKQYLNKKVRLDIDIDDLSLFVEDYDSIGEIVEYDDEWLVFKCYNKIQKKNVYHYLRINEIKSIDEIN